MADATHYVDPPRRSPRRGGIRSVAEFRDAGNRLGLGGIVEFTSPGCQVAVGDAVLCYPSGQDPQADKTRAGISTLEGIGPAFGAYAGVECWLGGDDYESAARRLLEQGEDRAVEEALNTWLATATAAGSATTVSGAVAALDDEADREYVGLPIIVMNRGDAVLAFADGSIEGDRDGNLWTANGSPVLASGQITADTVYAIGGLTVLTGPVGVYRTQNLPLNREFAIAERAYALAVDCEYVARYNVTEVP